MALAMTFVKERLILTKLQATSITRANVKALLAPNLRAGFGKLGPGGRLGNFHLGDARGASQQACSKTTRPARRRDYASSLLLERMDDGHPRPRAP